MSTQTIEKKDEPANLPVDLIRVVAIVLVIILHASVESYSSLHLTYAENTMYWWTSTVYNSIALPCVPLFIMLSGALLLRPSKVNEPIRVFLKKRLTRIGLAFAFWSTAYFAWSYFVNGAPLSAASVIQGLLNGPYYHMWFLYLIVGLYLLTPILRVVVTYGEGKLLRYLILLWFLGVAVVPLLQLSTGYIFNSNVFVLGGWIGYFILGAYVTNVRLRPRTLYAIMTVGFLSTMVGSWFLVFPFNSLQQYYFFFSSLTVGTIAASVALFLLLRRHRPDWPGPSHPYIGKVARAISVNTLTIYLFHLIILEALEKGLLGFKLSLTVLNPIFEVPLATAVTLFITLGLTLLMKKVPVLKSLIG